MYVYRHIVVQYWTVRSMAEEAMAQSVQCRIVAEASVLVYSTQGDESREAINRLNFRRAGK